MRKLHLLSASTLLIATIIVAGMTVASMTELAEGQIIDRGDRQQQQQQQPEEEEEQLPEEYGIGWQVASALGSSQGISDGFNDRIAGFEADPAYNYIGPVEEDGCFIFEDFYETACNLGSRSEEGVMATNFVSGFLDGYATGYLGGYYSGYFLDRFVDQSYSLSQIGTTGVGGGGGGRDGGDGTALETRRVKESDMT
jgi:hypothetical protein